MSNTKATIILTCLSIIFSITSLKAQILSIQEADSPVPPQSSTGTPSSESPSPQDDSVEICVELSPKHLSSRNGDFQTLKCRASICGMDMASGAGTDNPVVAAFAQPVFEWNSQLGSIATLNGTDCDDSGQTFWQSINLDMRYFAAQMNSIGVDEVKFTCSVSDTLFFSDGNRRQTVSPNAVSTFKIFRGYRVNDYCAFDNQCGDNMLCLKSSVKLSLTVCQCAILFISGTQYVQAIDDNYQEIICLPPLNLNDTCLYNQQCQATDTNSVCKPQPNEDPSKCECNDYTVFGTDGCQPLAESSTKPSVIWWIFMDESNDNNNHRGNHHLMSVRNVAYMLALLAIILPIIVVVVALMVLCYRTITRDRLTTHNLKAMFPTPKLRIDDLYDSKKSRPDDKYDLVFNDQLANQRMS